MFYDQQPPPSVKSRIPGGNAEVGEQTRLRRKREEKPQRFWKPNAHLELRLGPIRGEPRSPWKPSGRKKFYFC